MRYLLATVIIVLTACTLSGCKNDAQTDKTIRIAYVDWQTEIASTGVFKLALEEAGYQVELIPMKADEMWQAVATGKVDGMISAWLPKAHEEYNETYKDQVENLGPNLEGTRTGLVVPAYTNVLNIYELKTYTEEFYNRIFGIESEAGVMKKTTEAIKTYKLDYFIIEEDERKMLEKLSDAITKDKWIVVTGWSPHWMFKRWSLKFLDDPEDAYGKQGTINTVVRKNLHKDEPRAWQVFKNFYWKPDDMESMMLINHDNPESLEANAKVWLDQHPELRARWLYKGI